MEAQFLLGLGAILFEEDINQAKIWLEEAAKQGHVEAQVELGYIFFDEGDFERAKIWLKEAAKNGSTLAEHKLNLMSLIE